jgi:hypothetical protein
MSERPEGSSLVNPASLTVADVAWLNDDVVLLDGWADAVAAFLADTRGEFDVAGYARTFERSSQYLRFLKQRPWYAGRPLQNVSVFPQGSVWMARTDYLLAHNYPDRSMVKKLDDVLLGDMIWQTGGPLRVGVGVPRERVVADEVVVAPGECADVKADLGLGLR